MLTKKDIIAFNMQFDEGHYNNESSLDFALSFQKKNIAWAKKLAYLIRAIIIDHVFEEGNKRTALAGLYYCIEDEGYKIEDKRAVAIIKNIVLSNITSIKRIRWLIEDGIRKKN